MGPVSCLELIKFCFLFWFYCYSFSRVPRASSPPCLCRRLLVFPASRHVISRLTYYSAAPKRAPHTRGTFPPGCVGSVAQTCVNRTRDHTQLTLCVISWNNTVSDQLQSFMCRSWFSESVILESSGVSVCVWEEERWTFWSVRFEKSFCINKVWRIRKQQTVTESDGS